MSNDLLPTTLSRIDQRANVQLLTLQNGFLYFSQIKGVIQVFDLDSVVPPLIRQLQEVQQSFLNVPVIAKYPQMLGDLLFDPTIMAKRVRLYLQECLDKHDPERKHKWRWRIEMTVEIRANVDYFPHFIISVENNDERDIWLKGGQGFNNLFTPRIVDRFDKVRNQHHVSKGSALMFAVETIPDVIYKDMRKPAGEGSSPPVPLTTEPDLIDFYMRYADTMMLPYLFEQYSMWLGMQGIEPKLTLSEIRERNWPAIREKLLNYLHSNFNRVKADKLKAPDTWPKCLLSIIIHPPESHSTEPNPFIVIEFVSLYTDEPKNGYTAMTLETTGAIEALEHVSEFSTSKRLQ